MLEYLDHLMRLENVEFEAMFYYESLLASLLEGSPENRAFGSWLQERIDKRNGSAVTTHYGNGL